MNVYVFKTDVEDISTASMISEKLHHFLQLNDVHFDLQDCDNILRIEAEDLTNGQIEYLVESMGHQCSQL